MRCATRDVARVDLGESREKVSGRLGLLCAWLFLSAGCAHVDTRSSVTAAPSLDSLVPLAVGNRWVYSTSFQGQSQPDLVVNIVKEEDGCFIDDRPTPSRLRFDGDGLRDGNVRYLIKAPIEEGQKWMSVADVRTVERYEILAVGKEVRVPAGVFANCVTVRMEVRVDERRSMSNEMTFAPGVGIVEIRTDLKDGARVFSQSRMVLKSFDVKPSRTAVSTDSIRRLS